MIIYEDEFSDLDDTDVFGEGGHPFEPGDWRYENITLKVGSKIYTNCRAKVIYKVSIDGEFVEATLNNPAEYPEIIVDNPFVYFFEINNNAWIFNKTGSHNFYDTNTGLWSKSTGPLSVDEIKSVIAQILEYWEDEEEEVLEYESSEIIADYHADF